jgi:hypothetical protein
MRARTFYRLMFGYVLPCTIGIASIALVVCFVMAIREAIR